MKKGKKVFWGLLFLLGATALIVGKLGYLQGIGFWTILLSLGLLGLFIDGICNRSFGTILFSLAFLAIVNSSTLGLDAVTPWPVLGAALLGTIGLNLLFPQKWHQEKPGSNGQNENWSSKHHVEESKEENGTLYISSSFGETVKYLDGAQISRVCLKNSFGAASIYFNNAILQNNSAEVVIESSFGGVELYVPADWKVVMNVRTAFAGADEKGHCNPNGTNVLYINGSLSFAGLEIHYVN